MNTPTCVRVQFEIGHEATARSVKTSEGYTHDWEVYLRGVDNAEIHHFIEKVVFHLHASFRDSKRVIKEPPYTVKESGYGGFNLVIDVHTKSKSKEKLRFFYDLTLPTQGERISNIIKRKHDFANPSEDFRRKLIKGGGVGVGGSDSNKTSEKVHSTSDDAKHSSKSKPPAGPEPKKHKSKEHVKVDEYKSKNSFAELFGTPIKTVAPAPPKPSVKTSTNSGKSAHTTEKPAKDGHNSVKSVKPSPTKEKDSCKKENSVKKDKDGTKDKEKERLSKGDSKVKERDNHKDKESHKVKDKDKSKHVKRSCSPSSRSNSTKEESQKKPEESSGDKSSSKVETKVKHKEKRKDKEEKKPHKEEKKDPKDRGGLEKVDHKSVSSDHKKSDANSEKKGFSSDGKVDSKSKSSTKDERKEKTADKEKEKVENNKHKKHKKKERHKKDEKEKHKKKHEKVEDSKTEEESPEPVKCVNPLQLLEQSLSDKDSDTDFSANDEIIPSERSVSESPPSPSPQAPPAKMKEEKKPPDSKEEKHKRHDKKSKDEKESRKRKKKVKDKEDQPPEKVQKVEVKVEPKVEAKEEEEEEEEEREAVEEETSKSPERSSEVSKSPSPEGNKFTEEYVHQLRELQHKIMSLQDTSYLQKVVEVIAETGQFEITQRTFDFDLCALDRVTVKRLQDMFVTAS